MKKTKQNSIKKKETEEFISLVTETFDLCLMVLLILN
jgi:hypothetical protein